MKMDARQRLNQMRRFKSKINVKSNKNRIKGRAQQLSDLRQLIANKGSVGKQNRVNRNSVKNRIGFKTKNNNQDIRRQLVNKNRRLNVNPRNKRVSLIDQKLPIVMVNLTQVDDSPTTSSCHSTSFSSASSQMYSSSVEQNSRYNQTNESKNSVLVTNLNDYITDSDIKELFEDIGPIFKSSRVNKTTALIVYWNELDARKACQTYHNRLLDGTPMYCSTLSNDEYNPIETQPRRQPFPQSRQSSTLLDSQFRQINSLYSDAVSAQTSQYHNRKKSNVRFVVNV